MAEFLQMIERVQDEVADTKRLFGGEGQGVRKLGESRKKQDPAYMTKLAEAAKFLRDVYEGRKPSYLLKEAMTTSDFPLLFGDILDRQLLAGYREAPSANEAVFRVTTVRDFRPVSRKFVDGGDGVLSPVAEQEEYKYANVDEGQYTYQVRKYGRKFDFSWETMINDDLDALADMPVRLGRAARRTEEKFRTELYVDGNGPHAEFFNGQNGNVVPGNPALSVDALQQAFETMAKMTDPYGEPIFNQPRYLVVPPALEIVARNLLNALQIEARTAGGGTEAQRIIAQNWMQNRLTLIVDYYIPIVAQNNGHTSWFLFADPNDGRGALEFGRLRGHTEPEVFMKASNAIRVGAGGLVDPMAGDFDTDNIEYKVRHVFGGTRLDHRYAVASNGSGA